MDKLLGLITGPALPYVLIGLMAAWGGSLLWARHSGVMSERGRTAVAQVEAIKQAIKTKEAIQARNDDIAKEHETEGQKRKIIYRTITREVAAHAASTAAAPCIDDSGMRILEAAVLHRLPSTATQPDGAVP